MDQYVAAIHFAMTTMATVGYGDVAPRTRTERLVAMIIMVIGAHLPAPAGTCFGTVTSDQILDWSISQYEFIDQSSGCFECVRSAEQCVPCALQGCCSSDC